MMDDKTHELAVLKAQAKIRLEELKAQDSAKEVAGKAIGEDGLLYIFLIVLVGVGASLFLDGEKIAAVMWEQEPAKFAARRGFSVFDRSSLTNTPLIQRAA